MYRDCSSYEEMTQKIIDVYTDYGIISFPLDEKEICRRLGVRLLKYSEFPEIVSNVSDDAFYISPTKQSPPLILYNDKIDNEGRQRYNVFHELKHYVCGDTEESEYDENMADFFARYFMCPIPLLIYRGVDDLATIIADYNVSRAAATNVLRNLRNRRKKYDDKIFDHEKPLIDQIERGDVI